MNIRTWAARLVLLCSAFATGQVAAQAVDLESPYYAAALPRSGAWFDPAKSGTGVFVDISPRGQMFVSLFVYDANGNADWFTMQGRFTTSPLVPLDRDWFEPTSIGSLTSPLFRSRNGEALTGPYRTPNTTADATLGTAKIEFTTTRNAVLTIGTKTWNLRAFEVNEPGDIVAGRWEIKVWTGEGPEPERPALVATVDIQPRDQIFPVTPPPCTNNALLCPPLAPTGADIYSVKCVESCDESFWFSDLAPRNDPLARETYIWYDRATGRAVLDQAGIGANQLRFPPRENRQRYQLALDNNLIRGRRLQRLVLDDAGNTVVEPVADSVLALERLPQGKLGCKNTNC